jgi:phage/plasmid primase-like uncharacterized protein
MKQKIKQKIKKEEEKDKAKVKAKDKAKDKARKMHYIKTQKKAKANTREGTNMEEEIHNIPSAEIRPRLSHKITFDDSSLLIIMNFKLIGILCLYPA